MSGWHRVGGVPWWPLRKRVELRGRPREEPEILFWELGEEVFPEDGVGGLRAGAEL